MSASSSVDDGVSHFIGLDNIYFQIKLKRHYALHPHKMKTMYINNNHQQKVLKGSYSPPRYVRLEPLKIDKPKENTEPQKIQIAFVDLTFQVGTLRITRI